MPHWLQELADRANRADLTREQLDRLVEPLAFLFTRLAARAESDMPELKLFQQPTARNERYYRERARPRKGSFLSQVSMWQRPIFTNAAVFRSALGKTSPWQDCFISGFPAEHRRNDHVAVFLWRQDVFRRRSTQNCRPEITRLMAPIERMLRGAKSALGVATSWGMLARAVPVRYPTTRPKPGAKTEVVFPNGQGFERSGTRPQDRPYVSARVGAMLTSFFPDEPLSQFYSTTHWILVAPGRLFAVLPSSRSLPGMWLHAEHEPQRLATEERKRAAYLESKRPLLEEYRAKMRRAGGKATKGSRRRHNPHRRHATKPFSLQTLYEILDGLLGSTPRTRRT